MHNPFRYFNSSPEVIRLAVMMYVRYPLSLRQVEDLLQNAFFGYKSIIGDGLRARSPAGQGSEAVLGCEILNRMTALGRPVSYRIGR